MGTSAIEKGQSAGKENGQATQMVDTLWNQYEQSLEQLRKLRESREEAYLNAVREVVKYNQDFRFSLANLFQTIKSTNSEVVKSVSGNLAKGAEDKKMLAPELKEQLNEVTEKLEQLATAPLATGFDLIGRFEINLIENSEKYVKNVRERRSEWQQLTDEYVKTARQSHQNFMDRLEDSMKTLIKK
ncbi:hypothetical protein [Bacillus sp. JJ1764]|uniref:hypothetical protein n=1 Tax=Bacillus sp. JJ1764 TaxID=3122964 RepID=UPI0030003CB3